MISASDTLSNEGVSLQKLSWTFGGMGFNLACGEKDTFLEAGGLFRFWRSSEPLRQTKSFSIRQEEGTWTLISPDETFKNLPNPEWCLMNVETLCMNAMTGGASPATAFHASLLVQQDGKSVALLGRCGSGKSTLSLWLWHHCHMDLLGDDCILTAPGPGNAVAVPRRISVREPSRALLGEECWERVLSSPHRVQHSEGYLFQNPTSRNHSDPVPLSAIFLLERNGAETCSEGFRELDPATAVLSMAPYSNARDKDMGSAFQAASHFANSVPVYDLFRQEPSQMASIVQKLLDEAP